MNKQKFKVGDRVMVTRDVLGIRCAGKTGTIIEDFPFTIDRENGRYVRFDTHAESWLGQRDFVWTFNREIKHIHEKRKHPVIVITTDGKTTTATMRDGKKVLKTATATCSDKDTFDFSDGARVAFERLQGRDPFQKEQNPERPEKLVCVKGGCGGYFKAGKVYGVKWRPGRDVFDFGGGPFGYAGYYQDGRYIAPSSFGNAEFIPFVED